MTTQQISSIVRQVLAVLVTVYGILSATQQSLHLPTAVSAVLVAFGPIMLSLEHYLSDPSTGTAPAPDPVPVPEPAPAPVAPVVGPAPASVATVPVQTSFAQGESATISQPSPAPVAPASWSTMAASPPQAQTTPNPAPPAPAA
jgi:hypothetical protein